jgi:hypothetical protein
MPPTEGHDKIQSDQFDPGPKPHGNVRVNAASGPQPASPTGVDEGSVAERHAKGTQMGNQRGQSAGAGGAVDKSSVNPDSPLGGTGDPKEGAVPPSPSDRH